MGGCAVTKKEQQQQREANRQRQADFVKRLADAQMKILRVKAHIDDEDRIKAYALKLLKARKP
jgi:hypothetical protein